LSLWLACGEFGGLYRLQSFLPLVNKFRFPCRAIVLVQLCVAAGAAIGVVLLRRSPSEADTSKRSPADGLLLVGVMASVALAATGSVLWRDFVAQGAFVWLGPALVGAAAALIALATRGYRAAWPALAVLTAFDLTGYGLSYSVYGRTADLQEFVAA